MTIAKQSLLEAAKAVVKTSKEVYLTGTNRTALVRVTRMKALRQAVQDAEVYTPLTNPEHYAIWSASGRFMPQEVYTQDFMWDDERLIERAVIERLGLRWPE